MIGTLLAFWQLAAAGFLLYSWRRYSRASERLINQLLAELARHTCTCGWGSACLAAGGAADGWYHTRLPGEQCHPLHEVLK